MGRDIVCSLEEIIIRQMKKILFYIFSFTAASVFFMSTLAGTLAAQQALLAPDGGFSFVPAGAVMPHHLLVKKDINELYAKLAQIHEYKRIIIISPNHFNFGYHYIETTNAENGKFPGQKIDRDAYAKLIASKVVFSEPGKFYLDHGVNNHLPFIKKYFPNAVIVPLLIKSGADEARLNILAKTLSEIADKDTLVLASIDFTHYAPESDALMNDERTVGLLRDWSNNVFKSVNLQQILDISGNSNPLVPDAISMDSPESLYTLLRVMELSGNRGFSFVKRTSSAEILGIKDPKLNTSHIFGVFGK
jgi:AmmeMemoRadiSam system protein B